MATLRDIEWAEYRPINADVKIKQIEPFSLALHSAQTTDKTVCDALRYAPAGPFFKLRFYLNLITRIKGGLTKNVHIASIFSIARGVLVKFTTTLLGEVRYTG